MKKPLKFEINMKPTRKMLVPLAYTKQEEVYTTSTGEQYWVYLPPELTFDEVIQDMINKGCSQKKLNRYIDAGLNPANLRVCKCCDYELPEIIYSIRRDGGLNHVCKACWKIEPVKARGIQDKLNKATKKEETSIKI